MKTLKFFILISFTGLAIISCKKKETPAPTNSGGGTTPTPSDYYIFDGTTYTADPLVDLGSGGGAGQFNFFYSNTSAGRDMRLFFKSPTAGFEPAAGTYSVIAHVNYIADSTTCSIKVKNAGVDYLSTGGGVITVGKSGTQTTYKFTNIPLSGGKTVSGDFKY